MTTPTTPAAVRVAFEHDAEPMGFDLRRHECMVPEPWSEYRDINTGHRWGGYLAATHAATAREYALVAERDALRAMASELLAACQVAFDQTCSVGRPKDWMQLRSAIDNAHLSILCAALSAPAVEG